MSSIIFRALWRKGLRAFKSNFDNILTRSYEDIPEDIIENEGGVLSKRCHGKGLYSVRDNIN